MHANHFQNRMTTDMSKGFSGFVDEVMRGRENKAILNGSVGLSALDIGIPVTGVRADTFDPVAMLHNNQEVMNASGLANSETATFYESLFSGEHPLFDIAPDNFTLFGLDFPDMWQQMQAGLGFIDTPKPGFSEHLTPLYRDAEGNASTVASSIGLPDLPYGGLAHFAHMGMAIYDTGRTFQDLWNEPALKHNVFKIMTHPEMTETLLHRGVMLTVMGMLHPLGGVIAIGMGYLCAHLVHTAFKFLNNHKDTVQEVMQLPILKTIYDATGIKEWAEAKETIAPEQQALDPFYEERKENNASLPSRMVQAMTGNLKGLAKESPELKIMHSG